MRTLVAKTGKKEEIMSKVALITGITGQDGSFLAEFLIEKGYEVQWDYAPLVVVQYGRIEHLYLDEWVRDMKKQAAREPTLGRHDGTRVRSSASFIR